MTMLRPTSRMVAMNRMRSLFSFLAIKVADQIDRNIPQPTDYDSGERPAVISRPRMRASASQAGAACVPSSQSFTAQDRLTTAHRSQMANGLWLMANGTICHEPFPDPAIAISHSLIQR